MGFIATKLVGFRRAQPNHRNWPDTDEDMSVEGMLYGSPVRRPDNPAKQAA